MCQQKPTRGEFAGWPGRALAALWVVLFAWSLSVEWEAPDPSCPDDDLSYCIAHSDNAPPAEPGPPPVAVSGDVAASPAG